MNNLKLNFPNSRRFHYYFRIEDFIKSKNGEILFETHSITIIDEEKATDCLLYIVPRLLDTKYMSFHPRFLAFETINWIPRDRGARTDGKSLFFFSPSFSLSSFSSFHSIQPNPLDTCPLDQFTRPASRHGD